MTAMELEYGSRLFSLMNQYIDEGKGVKEAAKNTAENLLLEFNKQLSSSGILGKYYKMKKNTVNSSQSGENNISEDNTSIKREVTEMEYFLQKFEELKAIAYSLNSENDNLRKQKEELKIEIIELQEKFNALNNDYSNICSVINKARLAVADEEINNLSSKFRMNKNGDLERV
ncbi:hypothetical protein ACI2LM_13705 [Paenibacillus lautus]|uniref:hypothetical protein n=1 Tax=Paenibacillus lautus TaxID=1401 RepID=UPI00384CF1ED